MRAWISVVGFGAIRLLEVVWLVRFKEELVRSVRGSWGV